MDPRPDRNSGAASAREDQSTSTLAVEAAIKALQVANLAPTDLDLIIVTSSSPGACFPPPPAWCRTRSGATKAGAFDLLAACSGFIYAVNMAAQSIRSGSIKNALVIGSETLSRFVNWKDRNTCILFGDGAGAFVLQASDQPGGVLLAVDAFRRLRREFADPVQAQRHPATQLTVHEGKHFVQMDGKAVFRFATRVMSGDQGSARTCRVDHRRCGLGHPASGKFSNHRDRREIPQNAHG